MGLVAIVGVAAGAGAAAVAAFPLDLLGRARARMVWAATRQEMTVR